MPDQPQNEPQDQQQPALRVVRGDPGAEEVAALLAIVLARSGQPATAVRSPGWRDTRALVRRPLRLGRGAWRTSMLP